MGSGSVCCSLKFTECALQSDVSRSTKPAWVMLVLESVGDCEIARGQEQRIEVARKLMGDDDDDDPGRNICFRRVQHARSRRRFRSSESEYELSEYKSTRIEHSPLLACFPPPFSPFNHPLINHPITYNHGHITRGTRYRCQKALLLLPRQQLGGRIGRANSRGHRSRPPARSAMPAHRGQRLYVTFSGPQGIKIFGLNHNVS